MSFILEALRKSEHERQRQAGPVVSNPYAIPRRAPLLLPIGWIIGIAALLLVNLVVVLVLVLRDDPEPTTVITETQAPSLPPATSPSGTTAQMQTPAPRAIEPTVTPDPIEAPLPVDSASGQEPFEAPPPAEPVASVPTIHELNLQGGNALPPLRVDIHVYAQKPAERFVFINSRRYREGEQTNEGLLVEKITAAGVIMNRDGLRFLLPRP
jgi:general secretion pathway protein B